MNQPNLTMLVYELDNPPEKVEREFTKPELIQYYYQRLALITHAHLRNNASTKDFPEAHSDPQKFYGFDLAVELHRSGGRPWVG
jgi:hypothetical protein